MPFEEISIWPELSSPPRFRIQGGGAEMSSDSRKSLNHRDPPLFLDSRYQSQYQDCYLKSLNSCLDIKIQDFKVSIPVSISRLKLQKSWFQSWFQDATLTSLASSLNIKNQAPKVQKDSIVVLEAITTKVLKEDSHADS